MKPAKVKRSKNLELLNAALKGDCEKVREFIARKKRPGRLEFMAHHEHPGKYKLMTAPQELSNLINQGLFTEVEALALGEDYEWAIFYDD